MFITNALRSRPVQALFIAALAAGGVLTPMAATHAEAAQTRNVTVLQLNLCNGGDADCFKKLNRDRSVPEAISKINGMNPKPDVITLNEVCRNDVDTIATATGYTSGRNNFFSAFRRNPHGPPSNYPCVERQGHHNQDYGVGFLVRDHGDQVRILRYQAYNAQDKKSRELRVMACAEYRDLNVCTTHLVNQRKGAKTNDVAGAQCKELSGYVAEYARQRPTVVAGDFNLKYRGSPNVQDCVPAGFFRKGDGALQHVMASGQFAFAKTKIVKLKRTDHEGLAVTLRLN